MNRTILVTGATAGIGKATAERFAQDGDRLIITGRRKELLNTFASSLRQDFRTEVMALSFDIRKKSEVADALNSLTGNWKNIDILVNNSGLALGLDPPQEGDIDDWDTMIDTNLKGLLYVTRNVVPWMVARGRGHIFNVGSIAGREVFPKGNVYSATKHAVDALTKGMRIDLPGKGIRVTQIAPGAVETEFSIVRFKGDVERAARVYKGYEPLQGEDIAGIIFFIASLPERINVNDILVMPVAQANATLFHKEGTQTP